MSLPFNSSQSPPPLGRRSRRVLIGILILLLGSLALAAPFVAGEIAPLLLGLLLLCSGLLETAHGFLVRDRRLGNSAFLGSAMSVVAGLVLLAAPKLALSGLAVLLGLSFGVAGIGKMIAAARGRGEVGRVALFSDGFLNVLLGGAIAGQWPVTGLVTIGLAVGLHILSSGWAMVVGRSDTPALSEAEAARLHPDARLRLAPHEELAKLRQAVKSEEDARRGIDRYWRLTFLVTFFAIHVGRMDADWSLIGFLSPGVAVVGDVVFALLLAWGVATPLHLFWRWLTRPVERLAWNRHLAGADQGRTPGILQRSVLRWLVGRFRFAMLLSQCRRSPAAAFARGLQVGLPLAAVLIALNPVWGFSWYFNTENWATGAWERWTEYRVDTWREQMVRAVRELALAQNVSEADLFRITPDGVAGSADFSFVVIGDTGEGDASQHVLRDQFLRLGQRPEVKFLIVSSDVIYPSGAMRHYEPNFYLPFKGFTKPIYAVPGNHDWYDALEAFTANFLEPPSARVALRARREADHGLTTTTEDQIEQLIAEAARLRQLYGVTAAGQRAPYFEVQAERFGLVVVDTGILRRIDADQLDWLRAALERARGKFKMVVLGHPLYAGGRYQGADDAPFAAVHELLREHEVDVVMGGDTHYLEYYKEVHEAEGKQRLMHHFVNGGGGAYLSIGTPLDWPREDPVADCAIYPRTDAVIDKLDEQTALWKRPVWIWVKRLGAWPSSAEGMAAAFDFNHAPFFQSFMEVRVERLANRVRLIPHGVNGPLRWRDLEIHGQVMPAGRNEEEPVEFAIPMPRGGSK